MPVQLRGHAGHLVVEPEDLELFVKLLLGKRCGLLGLHRRRHRPDQQFENDQRRDHAEADKVQRGYVSVCLRVRLSARRWPDVKLVAPVRVDVHGLVPPAFRRQADQRQDSMVQHAEAVRIVLPEQCQPRQCVAIEQHEKNGFNIDYCVLLP